VGNGIRVGDNAGPDCFVARRRAEVQAREALPGVRAQSATSPHAQVPMSKQTTEHFGATKKPAPGHPRVFATRWKLEGRDGLNQSITCQMFLHTAGPESLVLVGRLDVDSANNDDAGAFCARVQAMERRMLESLQEVPA